MLTDRERQRERDRETEREWFWLYHHLPTFDGGWYWTHCPWKRHFLTCFWTFLQTRLWKFWTPKLQRRGNNYEQDSHLLFILSGLQMPCLWTFYTNQSCPNKRKRITRSMLWSVYIQNSNSALHLDYLIKEIDNSIHLIPNIVHVMRPLRHPRTNYTSSLKSIYILGEEFCITYGFARSLITNQQKKKSVQNSYCAPREHNNELVIKAFFEPYVNQKIDHLLQNLPKKWMRRTSPCHVDRKEEH